jgi:hypothetical protein
VRDSRCEPELEVSEICVLLPGVQSLDVQIDIDLRDRSKGLCRAAINLDQLIL